MEASAPVLPALDTHPDADISAAVEHLFQIRKGVNANFIDVDTREGIVSLSGYTDNILALERAERMAQAVRGVRGVINQLEVRTPDVPDNFLRECIEQALQHDPAAHTYPVRCTVRDGLVSVAGVVQSWAEKELVLNVVKGVKGVRAIQDELGYQAYQPNVLALHNSDEAITNQISESLAWNIHVDAALVRVSTRDRVVTLSGTVGTAAERAQVIATAWGAGALRVEASGLVVALWALRPELRGSKFSLKTDDEVAQAVTDALRFDPRVRFFEPNVSVRRGVVTLTGTVSNLKAKQAAEQDARDVVGVWDVRSLLKVRTEHATHDGEIQRFVREALARDPYVGRIPFVVNVSHGKVCLYGAVDSYFEQHQAESVAAGINGVVEVEARVQLPEWRAELLAAPAPGYAGFPASLAATVNQDHRIAENLRECIFWSPALHNQDIRVMVDNGRVTLTGEVDTWHDRKFAALCAYESGARDVNNHLRTVQERY